MPEARQLVTFWLGDHVFGIDVQSVQEIIRRQAVTPIPLSDPAIRGLINLRGQIVLVVDLKRRLRLPPGRGAADGEMNVVVRTANGPVSFQVDRIGDVIDVDATTFEAAPTTVRASIRELLAGIHKLPDRFLHVLAVDRIVEFRSPANQPNANPSPIEAH